jgi:L-threonylcarbamoyladenylate synthase
MPHSSLRLANAEAISDACAILRSGGLVAFPTETVYGLGADATNPDAVAGIFKAKGRPDFNPLICHVPDLAAAEKLGIFSDTARAFAKAFWPGALTLVVRKLPNCPVAAEVSAGLETIAIRVPDHPLAQSLLGAAGIPLAAPSANRSGAVSPTQAVHVVESLGDKVDLVLDGGACEVGLESTVLSVDETPPVLLRPGGVTLGMLRDVDARVVIAGQETPKTLKSPGMLESHYAPRLPVRMNAEAPESGEAWLAFGPGAKTDGHSSLNLSPTGDQQEAASNLFSYLRLLDRAEFSGIAVAPVTESGIGRAINDRLRRASAARPIPKAG